MSSSSGPPRMPGTLRLVSPARAADYLATNRCTRSRRGQQDATMARGCCCQPITARAEWPRDRVARAASRPVFRRPPATPGDARAMVTSSTSTSPGRTSGSASSPAIRGGMEGISVNAPTSNAVASCAVVGWQVESLRRVVGDEPCRPSAPRWRDLSPAATTVSHRLNPAHGSLVAVMTLASGNRPMKRRTAQIGVC